MKEKGQNCIHLTIFVSSMRALEARPIKEDRYRLFISYLKRYPIMTLIHFIIPDFVGSFMYITAVATPDLLKGSNVRQLRQLIDTNADRGVGTSVSSEHIAYRAAMLLL